MMEPAARQQIVGAALLTAVLGLFAIAITDWPHGLLTAGFIAVALAIAKNL